MLRLPGAAFLSGLRPLKGWKDRVPATYFYLAGGTMPRNAIGLLVTVILVILLIWLVVQIT